MWFEYASTSFLKMVSNHLFILVKKKKKLDILLNQSLGSLHTFYYKMPCTDCTHDYYLEFAYNWKQRAIQ